MCIFFGLHKTDSLGERSRNSEKKNISRLGSHHKYISLLQFSGLLQTSLQEVYLAIFSSADS